MPADRTALMHLDCSEGGGGAVQAAAACPILGRIRGVFWLSTCVRAAGKPASLRLAAAATETSPLGWAALLMPN